MTCSSSGVRVKNLDCEMSILRERNDSVKVLNRLRNYRKLWKNLFTFDLDDFTTSTNKRKLYLKGCSELEDLTNCEKKCGIEGGSSFCRYRWHVIQIFGLIFLAILLSTFFVYDEPPRKQNVDSVQKHRQEKEKDFLDMMIWKTGMTDGRIFQETFWIMVLVVEEENFDEVPRYIRIGNTRNFDRDRGNQRLAEIQNPGDIVPTVDLNLHRRNRLRSLVESSGFNSLSLRYDDYDDSSGIGNASVQHSDLQNREISMSYASGHPLRNTLSSGYQSGRRMHFSSGQHSFSLGSRIGEINEEPNSNINHTSLNLESNGIDISENNANQFLFNSPLQEAVESENLPQQRALDMSNHQVSTNVRSTGIREFGGENIQSETSTITMHSTESKTRSNDHSELSVNTPSRNTSLNQHLDEL
ncbi:unnamed protein product [Mytilus edulis]|uniref:Uncharacterized protein n=1 Tax=Mytilus edulis TaxID=6550 RepID=A0A8S3VDE9_MYTED|nr:unnamed protein product [Mytilus edulis]